MEAPIFDEDLASPDESLEKNPDKLNNTKYKSILEDSFKAFMGLLECILDNLRGQGVGYAVAYNFFLGFMDEVKLSGDYQDVQKYYHMLKELYDSFKWDLPKNTIYSNDPDATIEEGQHIVSIRGYPKHDKTEDPKNEIILATSRANKKKDAEEEAAKKALEKLDRVYNIRKMPPDLSKIKK